MFDVSKPPQNLQVVAYKFMLDRRLGNLYRVLSGWYIVIMENRVKDGGAFSAVQ